MKAVMYRGTIASRNKIDVGDALKEARHAWDWFLAGERVLLQGVNGAYMMDINDERVIWQVRPGDDEVEA